MKKILVPYDFSEYAESALDFAIQFSTVSMGDVTVLNVIEYPMATTYNVSGEIGQFNADDEIFVLELIKKTKSRLRELKESNKYVNVKFNTRVMIGNPYDGISAITEVEGIDLIIMGTKGATGLQEMFVGSNAEKVVRNSKCPVITIHKEQRFESIKDIVYATSLDISHGKVLEKFKEYQELFGSKVHLVWVNTPHDIINENLATELLHKLALEHHLDHYEVHVAKGFYPEEGILTYAWSINASMIALATHSHKGLAHLFLGSVAEDIVNHASIPVWTLSLKGHKK